MEIFDIITIIFIVATLAHIAYVEVQEKRRKKRVDEAWKIIAGHAYKHNLPLPGPWNPIDQRHK